jgi:hypothetical protein
VFSSAQLLLTKSFSLLFVHDSNCLAVVPGDLVSDQLFLRLAFSGLRLENELDDFRADLEPAREIGEQRVELT